MFRRNMRGGAVVAAAVWLAACTVPEHMEVHKGTDPQNADENVRFRTTYYFRVFDYCASPGQENADRPFRQIGVDSLFRFRMTGKANALATKVKFESGTLKSWQIDPFGATVIYDKEMGQFRYQSQEESQAMARRKLAKDAIADLMKIRTGLSDKSGVVQPDYDTKIKTGVGTALDELAKSLPTTPGIVSDASAIGRKAKGFIEFMNKPSDGGTISLHDETFTLKNTPAADKPEEIAIGADLPTTLANIVAALKKSKYARIGRVTYDSNGKNLLIVTYGTEGPQGNEFTLAASAASNAKVSGKTLEGVEKSGPCPKNFEVRRGFQLLGPQGVSTFNQDDRLIMAMATSAQPLIGTLNEISSRVLEQAPAASATLLPLVEERLRISEAQRLLQAKDTKTFGTADLDDIAKALTP